MRTRSTLFLLLSTAATPENRSGYPMAPADRVFARLNFTVTGRAQATKPGGHGIYRLSFISADPKVSINGLATTLKMEYPASPRGHYFKVPRRLVSPVAQCPGDFTAETPSGPRYHKGMATGRHASGQPGPAPKSVTLTPVPAPTMATVSHWPTPPAGPVLLAYSWPASGSTQALVSDLPGRTCCPQTAQAAGVHTLHADLNALPAGSYVLTPHRGQQQDSNPESLKAE
ncbi:hypothetical protein IC235_21215 [Hymenobacter sp. BT664]|uniref:Uncharacterized protein n=1 Tax=Hymenobacter montanus TaxID=2771359 RepID=A0A927BI16_9BACT|nr:hypothetical protein [Hymenobacter montanus]MBD2770414.1 hypothetical protein [Hymenobacter montanus]